MTGHDHNGLMVGARVRVHLNLHRGDWSVTVGGKVVANVDSIALDGVTFRYWQGGIDYILARAAAGKPRRRVVAWAEGTIALPANLSRAAALRFNPYRCRHFTVDGMPVEGAAYVAFGAGGVALAINAEGAR